MGGTAIPRLASEASVSWMGVGSSLADRWLSHDGDLAVFSWVGAGNGAMNRYAAVVL